MTPLVKGESSPIEHRSIELKPDPPRLITHQFPLRQNLVLPLGIPADLTEPEARRIAQFISALVFPREAGG